MFNTNGWFAHPQQPDANKSFLINIINVVIWKTVELRIKNLQAKGLGFLTKNDCINQLLVHTISWHFNFTTKTVTYHNKTIQNQPPVCINSTASSTIRLTSIKNKQNLKTLIKIISKHSSQSDRSVFVRKYSDSWYVLTRQRLPNSSYSDCDCPANVASLGIVDSVSFKRAAA